LPSRTTWRKLPGHRASNHHESGDARLPRPEDLGFEPLAEVFPDRQKLASAAIFTTVALLVYYRGHGTAWWDYLNTIETAFEAAAPLAEDVEPAALLISRRRRTSPVARRDHAGASRWLEDQDRHLKRSVVPPDAPQSPQPDE
jgi:hypothetical protein